VIVGRIEHGKNTMVLERVTSRQIISLFPQLAGEITQFLKGDTDGETLDKEIDYGRKPI
jgi:hypothetical protein